MNTPRWISLFLPALGLALLLAMSASNLAAQTEPLKQANSQDTRYYIYVSGIT
ncbi:MAG: hypothetical protein IID44_30145 [Planctomycetes bacterium]|nr:hypothetical protein [Planctomycetota bacterium]